MGTHEQEREPVMYTGGVKWLHEHAAWGSSPHTEMKLMAILCQAATVINSVSKFNLPSNTLESQLSYGLQALRRKNKNRLCS